MAALFGLVLTMLAIEDAVTSASVNVVRKRVQSEVVMAGKED